MAGAAPSAHPSGFDDTRDGLRLLRRYHEATLQYHERRAEIRFVIDGATGDLILPAEPGFAGEVGGHDVVLHLPDEIQRDLQLAATAELIPRPEAEESVDRWSAYHAAGGGGARPGARVWLRCRIDGGKAPHTLGEVYSGESLTRPNGLRKGEARLIKQLNADREALGRLCKSRARVDVADPLCVGIDPHGLDIRARFGIVRVEFDLEAASIEQAEACVRSMLEKAR
jgi:hypothetical protein